MPTVRYSNHNGRVRGQVAGGARTTYLTDALGSVTATVDGGGALVNAYRHKPYGGLLARSGAGGDPRYLWTGDTGSWTTGLAYAEQHNRARHYGSRQAGWTSVDPLWPDQNPFVYCVSDPITAFDPSGLAPCSNPPASCCCCPAGLAVTHVVKHRRDKLVLPPGFSLGNQFNDFAGISFYLEPSWASHAVGSPPPTTMSPCSLSWTEMWSGQTSYGVNGLGNTLEGQMWNGPTCSKKSICGGGRCGIFDGPGTPTPNLAIDQVRRTKKPVTHQICFHFQLSTSCSPGVCGADTVEKYYKFSLTFDYPYVSAKGSIHPSLSPSSSSCRTNSS